MKRKSVLVLIVALLFSMGALTGSLATSETAIPFSEWLAAQSVSTEEPIVQDTPIEEEQTAEGEPLAAEEAVEELSVEEQLPKYTKIQMNSRGVYVQKLQEKLIELGFLVGIVDGIYGPITGAALKDLQKVLGQEETGIVDTVEDLNSILALGKGDGVNLAIGTSNEWSDWMTPEYNAKNRCFVVAYAYPGTKSVGDAFTCQVEIEYRDVSPGKGFRFFSQGSVDGDWKTGNVWSQKLVKYDSAPNNGTEIYTCTSIITEENVHSSRFDLGFRCDNWKDGAFRVRRVMVERGVTASDWVISERDMGDGINLAVGVSSEWSEWMAPKYDAKNQTFTVSKAILNEKMVGEPFTCQVEIEFQGVSGITAEDKKFSFRAQGKVDDSWGELGASNIWNNKLVNLKEAPSDGIQKYIATTRISEKNVDANTFELGFRCDYWASGRFRVRCVKVENGTKATEWTPAI